MSETSKKRLVYHHNMYGPSCEIASADNADDFKVYCHREHKICIPEGCNLCSYFGGDVMGKGVCCIWEETDSGICDDHVVPHDEAYFELQRVENPDMYKSMMKMIDEGDLDLCEAWLGLD